MESRKFPEQNAISSQLTTKSELSLESSPAADLGGYCTAAELDLPNDPAPPNPRS